MNKLRYIYIGITLLIFIIILYSVTVPRSTSYSDPEEATKIILDPKELHSKSGNFQEHGGISPTMSVHDEQYLPFVNFSTFKTTEREYLLDRLPIFIERSRRVSSHCSKRPGELKSSHPGERLDLLWELKHTPNVVYCPLYKVASTTWISNFLLMVPPSEMPKESLLGLHRFKAKFGWNHHLAYKLYKAPDTAVERNRVLQKSVRFLVVRHPFMRLLSLYKVKMERASPKNSDDNHFEKIRKDVIAACRPVENTLKSMNPTFREFVQYLIVNLKTIFSKIPSIKPQWETCQVCHVNYNVIMKLETFEEDEKFLTIMAKYEEVKKAEIPPSIKHAVTTSDMAREYYSQLERDQIKKLYNIYKNDFDLFDYTIEEFLSMENRTKH